MHVTKTVFSSRPQYINNFVCLFVFLLLLLLLLLFVCFLVVVVVVVVVDLLLLLLLTCCFPASEADFLLLFVWWFLLLLVSLGCLGVWGLGVGGWGGGEREVTTKLTSVGSDKVLDELRLHHWLQHHQHLSVGCTVVTCCGPFLHRQVKSVARAAEAIGDVVLAGWTH